jgi:hypothetical protein
MFSVDPILIKTLTPQGPYTLSFAEYLRPRSFSEVYINPVNVPGHAPTQRPGYGTGKGQPGLGWLAAMPITEAK